MSLTIKCYPLGPLSENTYLIKDDATGLMAVVDPGYFIPDIADIAGDPSLFKYILLTHGHYDHFAAAELYEEAFPDAQLAVPAGESRLLSNSLDNKWMAIGKNYRIENASLYLSEGDKITLGETVLTVIETPGHTEGGICYDTGKEIFTGDTLFRLSVGNTSLETGNWDDLVNSITDKLYTLDEDRIVYPGHGAATTIGYEKRANPFV
jgi:glyoxylase-like metal-dependent hydrolase (beta-lactamase superfamily II)